MAQYKVVEQFHKGRMYRAGDIVELTDKEATALGSFIKPLGYGTSISSSPSAQDADHQERIAAMQEQIDSLNLQLGKECEAKHEYKNALDDLTKQIDELTTQRVELFNERDALQVENEQLKAAAKPATKGAK